VPPTSCDPRGGARQHLHGAEGSQKGITTVEHLVEHLREIVEPSTAIVCVGNELCGDDAAGVLVARRLAGAVPWKVFDTQTVPESFLMKIVEAAPASVVLIDALDFGAAPGAVELIEASQVAGQGPSTHGPAPLAFLDILQMMHPCRRVVLGIQPELSEFGSSPSEAGLRAVDRIVEAFLELAGSVSSPPAENPPPQ